MAMGVAAVRLGFPRRRGLFGDPEADDRFAAAVAARLPAGSTMPLSLLDHLRRRTTFFDTFTLEALAAGITQIVIVGAGYDGRSLRYAQPGVHFVELDHPATQADKLAVLDGLGLTPLGCSWASLDLRTDPIDPVLATVGHDPGAPSAFLFEGVAAYLPDTAVRTVLEGMAAVAAPASRLALSVPFGRTDPVRHAALSVRLADHGEPMRATLSAVDAPGLLHRCGWVVDGDASRPPTLLAATRAT
jgi:methyltransferase (TIGR00027 family)